MLLHRSCNKAMLHWQQPDRHGHAACACFAVSIVLAFTLLSMHAVSLYMCATALDQRMGRSHAGLVLLYHMIYRHMNKPRAGIHINAALRHEAYRVAQRCTAEAHSRGAQQRRTAGLDIQDSAGACMDPACSGKHTSRCQVTSALCVKQHCIYSNKQICCHTQLPNTVGTKSRLTGLTI